MCMTSADNRALRRLLGKKGGRAASTDDLQNLLLQVTLALLMVFMIAYFIFVGDQKKARAEEVMTLNRQKLELALDKVAEDHRVRYGLNALMTQGVDGKRAFEPDSHVRDGRLALSPAALDAFSKGAKAAFADYSDRGGTAADWKEAVLVAAGLKEGALEPDLRDWLDQSIEQELENVRLDVRGVQRSLAARLQRQWVENPAALGDVREPGEIAAALKRRSLALVSETVGAEVLP